MKQNILPYRGSYYPVLGQLLHEINVAGEINKVIDVQDTQANIDVGTFTCLMILNILGDVNIRLYRMGEFFEDKALPLMIPWRPDIHVDEITDDRAARVLDILWNADPQKIFSAVTHAAIHVHNLDTSIIHGDTTSKSFIGAFENSQDNGLIPWITYGYSKDHRPDLKQLIFGVGSTADGGVPILGEIADGNESDKTLNGRWVTQLRSLLGKNDVEEFLLYIADSALITTDNLTLMEKYHIDFISRLPGNFSREEQLKRTAYQQNIWVHLGKLSEVKTAAVYHVCDMTGEINNQTYRFVVVKSSQKDQRKLKALDHSVQQDYTNASKILTSLSKRPFACKQDAEIEIEKLRTKPKILYHQVTWIITETAWSWRANIGDKPNVDITEVSYSIDGNKLTLKLEVAGTIQTSEYYWYNVYFNSSDTIYYWMWSNGSGLGAATNQGQQAFDFVQNFTVSGNSISAEFNVIGNTSTGVELWGQAHQYTTAGGINKQQNGGEIGLRTHTLLVK